MTPESEDLVARLAERYGSIGTRYNGEDRAVDRAIADYITTAQATIEGLERERDALAADLHKVQVELDADFARAETAEAAAAELRAALGGLLRCEYESAGHGLRDCVDNNGGHYQSQFLADQIKLAEAALSTKAP